MPGNQIKMVARQRSEPIDSGRAEHGKLAGRDPFTFAALIIPFILFIRPPFTPCIRRGFRARSIFLVSTGISAMVNHPSYLAKSVCAPSIAHRREIFKQHHRVRMVPSVLRSPRVSEWAPLKDLPIAHPGTNTSAHGLSYRDTAQPDQFNQEQPHRIGRGDA